MESSDWQSTLSTVRERTQYAFEKSLFCDVKFTVDSSNGGKDTLQANKYILAISSPVFEAMFYGDLAETYSTIDLPDCTKEGLQQMLHFVYSDEVNLTGSNVMEVLYVAEKYIMPFLVEKCSEYLQERLKPEEVFIILPRILCCKNEKLEQHCWSLVDKETKKAVFSNPFFNVSREVLCQVLARDTLRIKEIELFRAVDQWAAKKVEECALENTGKNKRAVLGEDVIKMIRFPVMKVKEFSEVVLPCEILKKNELTELFQNFYSISESTSMFNRKQRLNYIFTSSFRFDSVKPPVETSNTDKNKMMNAIQFTTNQDVSLLGIRMFGRPGAKFRIDLKITEGDNTTVIQSSSNYKTESELTDDSYYGFTITLSKPVKLNKNVWYRVRAYIDGLPTYTGIDGKSVVGDEDSIKITYRSDSGYFKQSSVSHGQFPAFLLQEIGLTED